MKKCTSLAVLAGQSNRVIFIQQTGIGHGFGETPITIDFPIEHFLPVIHYFFNPVVQLIPLRQGHHLLAQSLYGIRTGLGITGDVDIARIEPGPVPC